MCDRCEELEEDIAYLKSELGLRAGLDEIEALRKAFGLTPSCAKLVLALYRAKGRTVTQLQMLEIMPPRYTIEDDRTSQIVNVQCSKTRKALGPGLLQNVWGQGFKLSPAGLDIVGLALGETPQTVTPTELQDLHDKPSEDLRGWVAHIAGIPAHRDGDGGLQTAIVYRRITDRLTGQPRVAA